MEVKSVSRSTLKRLPAYLTYLRSLPAEGPANISATSIAAAMKLGEVQVRKDLSQVSNGGKPKIGYNVMELAGELERYLGYNDCDDAVVVGAGKLGRALLSYDGFRHYGLNIVAAFDLLEGQEEDSESGKPVFDESRLLELVARMNIRIGIITTPAGVAQRVCDELAAAGVRGILNFAPVHLKAPEGVIVRNEDLAAELAALSNEIRKSTPEG